METAKERREARVSTARRRAEQHEVGYATTTLRIPDGLGFWEMKEGVHRIDIVPYRVGKGNPFVTTEGELHFERTYYSYKRIGPAQKYYIAPGRTFGKPDFVQDWRVAESRKENPDVKFLKSLVPKERQLFLVWDHADKSKGVQLWDLSFHVFGKLLDQRIKSSSESEGWDFFYMPDATGLTLRITVKKESAAAFEFLNVLSIDFQPRTQGLPDNIVNHGFCLDSMLIEMSYDGLRDAFLGGGSNSSNAKAESKHADSQGNATAQVPASVRPHSEREQAPASKPKPPVAKDYGLSEGMKIRYQGRLGEIRRISGDGTSLTLLMEDDEVEKAIKPDEVERVVVEESKGVQGDLEQPESEADDLDKDWDADWDK